MKLYSREHLVKVLNQNLNFETYEDETLGPVIVMDNFDAYKYAVITGHGYLDINEPELRVIFKRDMYRVFNQVFQYEIQFGIFNTPNVELFSTTKKHIEHYPFIVEGDYKKLIFVDYEDKIIDCEPMLYNKLKKIANYVNGNGEKSQDYIICPIRKGKLVDFEPFFEYVVSEIYNRNGYITDTQIPFFYGVGTPDLAVYDFKDIIKHIQKYIDVTGFSIFELMTINTGFDKKRIRKTNVEPPQSLNAVFEVKTGSTDGSQIIKYIYEEVFSNAYEIIPHKKQCSTYAGLITFKKDGSVRFENNNKCALDEQKYLRYKEWLIDYMKFYIIGNLEDAELDKYKKSNKIHSMDSFIRHIRNWIGYTK